MRNPYEAPEASAPSPAVSRAIGRYWLAAVLLAALGLAVMVPGAVLLNQSWQLVPTNTFITDIELNGRPISMATVIRISLIAGGSLLVAGGSCLAVGLRNRACVQRASGHCRVHE